MSFEEIRIIPVNDWAAKDSVLLLWTTWPKNREAHDLIDAWGFSYVTTIPWVKYVEKRNRVSCSNCGEMFGAEEWVEVRRGIGFWAMAATEGLMVAVKGNPVRKNVDGGKNKPIGLMTGEDPRLFYAPIGKHSAKPLLIHEYAERYLFGPYLEMFATEKRRWWTSLGLATGFELGEWGVRPFTPRRGTRHGTKAPGRSGQGAER